MAPSISCYQPQTDLLISIWSADPPPNSGAGPTPREVAQLAIDQMKLTAIDIGIAPKARTAASASSACPSGCGWRTPTAHTWGPITASAPARAESPSPPQLGSTRSPGTWVTATEVTCTTAGTPYEAAYGNKKSPDCGHVYMTSSSSEARREVHGHGDVGLGHHVGRRRTDGNHPAERTHPGGADRHRRSAGARAVTGRRRGSGV